MLRLEPGRPRARGHPPEPRVALDQRPEVVERALVGHRLAADVDPDELAVEQVAVADLLQPRAAEEVRLLVPLDEPLEPAHVQRRVLDPDVRAVVEDPGLDPAGLARRDHADPVRLPRLEHALEQLVAAARVLQVELVADLPRPPGPADHDRDAVDLGLGAEVVPEVGHRVAEQVAHHVLRARALDLHRRDVGLEDRDVHPPRARDAGQVQQRVRIGERQPEPVPIQTQQHRVVHDAAPRRVSSTYRACIGSTFVRSRQVTRFTRSNASGPRPRRTARPRRPTA